MPENKGDTVVIVNGTGFMTRVKVAKAVFCAESRTPTVNVVLPAVVGAPDSNPAVVIVKPAGRVLPLCRPNVYGDVPPDAVIVWLYNFPTVPAGSVVVVMARLEV